MTSRSARLALPALAVLLAACVGPDLPRASAQLRASLQTHGELAVVRSGSVGARKVLFLHGTPGRWDNFADFLDDPELRERFDMFAIDRPGFGNTRLPLMPDLDRQAEALEPWCRDHGPFIVVGHSLGAPLGLALAVRAPECVEGILSIAGSVSARYERPRWYNRLAEWPLLRSLVPDAMRRANREVLALPASLEALYPALARLQVPLLLVQGAQDGLVDPRSARDLMARLPPTAPVSLQWLPDKGHFVLWDEPGLIRQALIRLAESIAVPGRGLSAAAE